MSERNDAYLPVPHPEEVRATWEFRIWKIMAIRADARCTPAGIIAAGITASAIILATACLLRGRRF